MNKYLEKIALNRYEKHLYDKKGFSSDPRLNNAGKKLLDGRIAHTMSKQTSDIEFKKTLKAMGDTSIIMNRKFGRFSKGEDILAKKNPGYARIAGPLQKTTPADINHGGTNKFFKDTAVKPKTLAKAAPKASLATSILSKAKSILGNKNTLKGGALMAGGAAALAGGAYLSTRSKKDTA